MVSFHHSQYIIKLERKKSSHTLDLSVLHKFRLFISAEQSGWMQLKWRTGWLFLVELCCWFDLLADWTCSDWSWNWMWEMHSKQSRHQFYPILLLWFGCHTKIASIFTHPGQSRMINNSNQLYGTDHTRRICKPRTLQTSPGIWPLWRVRGTWTPLTWEKWPALSRGFEIALWQGRATSPVRTSSKSRR